MRVERAYLAKEPHVPRARYKYRLFSDDHKDALKKGILWLSSPERFNDPYDSNVFFDTDRFLMEVQSPQDFIASAKEMVVARRAGKPWSPKPISKPIRQGEWRRKMTRHLLVATPAVQRDAIIHATDAYFDDLKEQLVRQMSCAIREGFSVLCLAENSTSVLMWSHYSQDHQGFCIEYDFKKLAANYIRRRFCCPVFYRRKLTDATRYMSKVNLSDYNNLFPILMCLLKSDEWAYEREWRIVEAIGPGYANREIAMPKPSAIILGALVRPADEDWMRSFCNDNAIPLKKVFQRHNEFRLEIRNLA